MLDGTANATTMLGMCVSRRLVRISVACFSVFAKAALPDDWQKPRRALCEHALKPAAEHGFKLTGEIVDSLAGVRINPRSSVSI